MPYKVRGARWTASELVGRGARVVRVTLQLATAQHPADRQCGFVMLLLGLSILVVPPPAGHHSCCLSSGLQGCHQKSTSVNTNHGPSRELVTQPVPPLAGSFSFTNLALFAIIFHVVLEPSSELSTYPSCLKSHFFVDPQREVRCQHRCPCHMRILRTRYANRYIDRHDQPQDIDRDPCGRVVGVDHRCPASLRVAVKPSILCAVILGSMIH